jgi:hypothetical protein
MLPYVVVMMGAIILGYQSLMIAPDAAKTRLIVQSDAVISQLIQTKRAASQWYRANPGTPPGFITAANITANLPTGITYSAAFRSYIAPGSQLYTYSVGVAGAGEVKALGQYTGCSELAGAVIAGSLLRPSCQTSGGTGSVPVFIPLGSLVISGY